LLAGVFAGAVATWAARALRARAAAHAASPATRAAPRASARPWLLAVGPALVVTTLLCGVVYAGTPDAYAGGWYRLYTPCEFEALHHVAAEANADPGAVIVTGDWQAKLVLAALTNDTQRVWFKPDVFTSADSRDKLVDSLQSEGRPLIVVLDRYLATGTPDADTAFVSESPWHPMGSWCANMGVAQPRMAAYATDGGAQ
jgi:hypothetical protein